MKQVGTALVVAVAVFTYRVCISLALVHSVASMISFCHLYVVKPLGSGIRQHVLCMQLELGAPLAAHELLIRILAEITCTRCKISIKQLCYNLGST